MPARTIFLDTGGWIALLNASDALHSTADARWRDLGLQGVSVLLTDWVIAETGNGLARAAATRLQLSRAVDAVRASVRATAVVMDESLLDRSLALYRNRQDKTWGLVDCASFTVMHDHGVEEAFTPDRHFEQAGFRCLLPTVP